MTKKEFFELFRQELAGLPKDDLEERVAFYEEIINDKMDEGKSEEQAIAELDSVQTIVEEIARETSLMKLVKEKYKPKRSLRGWEIAMIILGFPLWLPLLITGIVLIFVFYLLTWLISIIAWAVEVAFVASGFAGIICFLGSMADHATDITLLGMGIAGIGGAILFVFVCYYAFILNLKISKGIFLCIKKSFMRRGNK